MKFIFIILTTLLLSLLAQPQPSHCTNAYCLQSSCTTPLQCGISCNCIRTNGSQGYCATIR